MSRSPSDSLHAAIARRLALGLTCICIAGGVAIYLVCVEVANAAYDRSLLDDVQVLASHLRMVGDHVEVGLPQESLFFLVADDGDDVGFRITESGSGRVLASHGNLGALPHSSDTSHPFRTVNVDGDTLRVVSISQRVDGGAVPVMVEVGETVSKRDEQFHAILLVVVLAMAGVLASAFGLVWTGLRRRLSPLRALESEAGSRLTGDLRSLDATSVPSELRGLLDAINLLVARTSASISHERRFIANAAHQLKTPLTALRLHAQLAAESESAADAALHLEEVVERTAYYGRLVDQLLSMSRVEAGALDFERIDVVGVAKEVIQRCTPEAIARNIDLGVDADDPPVWLQADLTLLGELLTNLVTNALRHGTSATEVTVSVHGTPDGDVELKVTDNGVGLSDNVRRHLFERFAHGDTNRGSSVGLGLAIVREIAQRFGGRVEIASRPEFDGVRATVRFPAPRKG